MRRFVAGVALLACLCAPAAVRSGPPESRLPGPVHEETGAPPPDEAILDGFLLPTPKGYQSTGLVDRPGQQDLIKMPQAMTDKIGFPYRTPNDNDGMGWIRPDRVYYAQINRKAREIPRNLAGLPVVRFNNIDQNREREIRFREHGEYDQWFLNDLTIGFTSLLTIHRKTRHAYFFDYDWDNGAVYQVTTVSNCFTCHPSGPRMIRTYDLPKTDAAVLRAFNRRILSYGAIDYGDNIDPKRMGPPVSDARCVGCHDGKNRGKIYRLHGVPLAYYLTKLRNMPPGNPLALSEAQALFRRFHAGWKTTIWDPPRLKKAAGAGAECGPPADAVRLRRVARALPAVAIR